MQPQMIQDEDVTQIIAITDEAKVLVSNNNGKATYFVVHPVADDDYQFDLIATSS